MDFSKEPSLDFSQALAFLKTGKKLTRKTWHGVYMWVKLIDTITDGDHSMPPWLALYDKHGEFGAWRPEVRDILASDWMVVK